MNNKNILTLITIINIIFNLASCNNSSPTNNIDFTILNIGTQYNELPIASGETNYYKFNTNNAGIYRISLTNLTSDSDWYLYDPKGKLLNKSIEYELNDEIKNIDLLFNTTYALLINEWNNQGSSTFSLLITGPITQE